MGWSLTCNLARGMGNTYDDCGRYLQRRRADDLERTVGIGWVRAAKESAKLNYCPQPDAKRLTEKEKKKRTIVLSRWVYRFIRAIRAVGVAVAAPPDVDAVAVLARELRARRARGLLAVLLVTSVFAVVVSVAGPALLDALPVGARELVGATGLICAWIVHYNFN